jgi:predicted GNAT family acetyltransferase
MQHFDLDKENINNLTNLWKLMGTASSQELNAKGIYRSRSWPHRYWQDWDTRATFKERLCYAPQDRKKLVLPVFQNNPKKDIQHQSDKESLGLTFMFKQQAMYLDMHDYTPQKQQQLNISKVTSEKDTSVWCNIASQAFNYEIHVASVILANLHPEVTLLLADIQGQPVATAMLHKTGHVTGIHQMGVPEQYRGQGIARNMMHEVLGMTKREQACRYAVLQASAAGESLYISLGFKAQFTIENYMFID